MKFVATIAGQATPVDVSGAGGVYRVTIGDQVWDVDARFTSGGVCSLLIGGASYSAGLTEEAGTILVDVGGESYAVEIEEAIRHAIRTRGGDAAGGAARTLTAPLPGRVTHVAVRAGDRVAPGDTLLVIEAMKMENEFKASAAGTVAEVRVEPGQAVNAGDVLLVLGA
jgi:biotin carboxyl carrier protein